MSEKIYGWLLRLFPSHFRQGYGDEALLLFRDRAREEK
jgi:RimJ/RimL family protein N-acetyltransferase